MKKRRVREAAKDISNIFASNLTEEWRFTKVSGLLGVRSAVVECGA